MAPDVPVSVPREIVLPPSSYYPAESEDEARNWEATKYLIYVLLKWRWLIFVLFLAFTAAAAAAMYWKPPIRIAVAKVLIQADRAALQISGLSGNTGGRAPTSQVLQSEVETIESRDVLLPVAKALLTREGSPPPSPEEIAKRIDKLRGGAMPLVVPETNVIQVTYTATTSAEALHALNLIVAHYLLHTAETHTGSTKLLEFYEQERERAREELNAAEEEVRDWQRKNNIVAIDEQINGQLRLLTEQERALAETEAEETLLAMNRDRAPLVTQLQSKVISAQVRLDNLRLRYTDSDRRIQEQKDRIAVLESQFASARRFVSSALATRLGTLRKQIAETSATLLTFREKKVESDRLSRAADLARDSFILYGKSLEEARIAARLDEEQLSRVTVVEKPHATEQTDFSRRVGTVVLAGIVGLSLGVALAFLLELLNHSLRTHEDVEAYLKLPVLAVIPDLRGNV